MASSSNLTTLPLLLLLLVMTSSAQLSTNFYSTSCPNIFKTIKPVVKAAIAKEKRMGASLVRLFFHDCFVNGCDGSILFDDTSNFKGEQHAIPNNNSVRGYEVIGKIKSAVEKVCPGVVSCADIVAVAARDSVVILGGPNWSVKLGRRDSRKASRAAANKNIPPPSSNLTALKSSFKSKGLSEQDLVALSGAHTIGQARCTSFRPHIYNDTNIDKSFAKLRQSNCPATPGSGDNRLSPEDLRTPTVFDNNYYKNLMVLKGQLHSDQELFNKASTDSIVKKYSTSQSTFFSDFVTAMIKMGDVTPLTGTKGEIRKQCGKVN